MNVLSESRKRWHWRHTVTVQLLTTLISANIQGCNIVKLMHASSDDGIGNNIPNGRWTTASFDESFYNLHFKMIAFWQVYASISLMMFFTVYALFRWISEHGYPGLPVADHFLLVQLNLTCLSDMHPKAKQYTSVPGSQIWYYPKRPWLQTATF